MHRYGPQSDFEDYLFYEPREQLEFVRNRNTDEAFPIGNGTPVLMNSKVLLGIAVTRDGKKLDRNHYRLSLVATFRYRYAGRNIFSIRRSGDRVELIENAKLAAQVMPAQEYRMLRSRLIQLFEGLSITGASATPAKPAGS
jgi:hypothetical protein